MPRIRIVGRYAPSVGEWYVIQRKFLFWWITYPYSFHELYMVEQMIRDNDFNVKINNTVIKEIEL